MKLKYDQLPKDISESYSAKDIHKIVKPSATLISLHLKNRTKDVWHKKGSSWLIKQSPKDESLNRK